MGVVEIINSILTLLAGIGVFLIACTTMSTNLESISGNKLKALFGKASKSRLLGVGIGTVGTAAIQSSGATTVMVIGFVNTGIMTLTQAATVIYGANIGTTVTGLLAALGLTSETGVSTATVFAAITGIGAFILAFSRKDIWKKIGGSLAGFGMLFVGLSMMKGSMESFAELEAVKLFLASISNGILLVVIGAVFTAIIQSSSVMTTIAIAMVGVGLISLDQGIFLTMGSNIGSCVVALIAGLTSSRNAKRTSLIHLFFNTGGVIVFMAVGYLLSFLTGGRFTYATIFEHLNPGTDGLELSLALFHLFFNVATVILVLPLTKWLVALVTRIIPIKKSEGEENPLHVYYISDHLLKTPPVAVQQMKNEIIHMAGLALENFNLSLDMICSQDLSEIEGFRTTEQKLNYLNREIVHYAVRLSELPLSEKDHVYISTTFRSVSDLERVGDYAENIVEYAQEMKKAGASFSKEARKEIAEMRQKIEALFNNVMAAYTNEDHDSLAAADRVEEEIDVFTDDMTYKHIRRLNEGLCNTPAGSQYLSLASNAERVADHFMNVGKTIKEFL